MAADQDTPDTTDDAQDDTAPATPAAPTEPVASPAPDSNAPAPAQPAAAAPDEDVIPPKPAVIPDSGPPIVSSPPPQTAPNIVPPVMVPIDPNELKTEAQNVGQDLATGQITPHTYADLFAKKDTLGKIGTLFGILVGSAGAGLSKQPNLVADMMKQAVNNDLDAQKSSAANAQNFVRLSQAQQLQKPQIENLRKIGALTDSQANAYLADAKIKADTLGHMVTNRAALHSLILKAQAYPEGSADRATADQQVALLANQVDLQNSEIADQAYAKSAMAHALFGVKPGEPTGQPQASNNPQAGQQNDRLLAALGKPDMAAYNQQHRVSYPGVSGEANRPLAQGDRDKMDAAIQFNNQLAGFKSWSKAHTGDLSPADYNEGQALSAELNGAYRNATSGGVYKEGEKNFINKIVPDDPTKFFNEIRVAPALNTVQREHQAKMKQLFGSYGFTGVPTEDPTWKPPVQAAQKVSKSGRPYYVDAKTGEAHYGTAPGGSQ